MNGNSLDITEATVVHSVDLSGFNNSGLDLQAVTDNGNSTNHQIISGSLKVDNTAASGLEMYRSGINYGSIITAYSELTLQARNNAGIRLQNDEGAMGLYMADNSNIIIGTTTDNGAKLQVEGKVNSPRRRSQQ